MDINYIEQLTSLGTQLCLEFPPLILESLNQAIRTFLKFSRVPEPKYEANRSRGSRVMIGHQAEITTFYIKT